MPVVRSNDDTQAPCIDLPLPLIGSAIPNRASENVPLHNPFISKDDLRGTFVEQHDTMLCIVQSTNIGKILTRAISFKKVFILLGQLTRVVRFPFD